MPDAPPPPADTPPRPVPVPPAGLPASLAARADGDVLVLTLNRPDKGNAARVLGLR